MFRLVYHIETVRVRGYFIRQPAQLFADALGLFVIMHDRILKQGAWPAVLSSVVRSAKEEAHARRRLKSLDRLYRTCPP